MEEVVHCIVVDNGKRLEIDLPLGATLEYFMNLLNNPTELTYFSESGKNTIENENHFKQCINHHAMDVNDRIIFNVSRTGPEEKKQQINQLLEEREEKDRKYLKQLEEETKKNVVNEKKQYKGVIKDEELAKLLSLGFSKTAILTAVSLYGADDYHFLLKTLEYNKSNAVY